jgi:hypothetical protein
MQTQKPVKGGRFRLSSTVLKSIRKRVEQDARHSGVSMSFVQAVILAKYYGIKKQEFFAEVRQNFKVFAGGRR